MKSIIVILIVSIALLCAVGIKAQDEGQKMTMPRKVEVDSDYNGTIDRIEHYDAEGNIIRIERDSDGDGTIDERIVYKNGQPLKGERDSNADGKPDIWIEY